MKEKKIGVSKVVIQFGNKEVSLTVEQVKELRDTLDLLLGGRTERVEHIYYPYQWTSPYWTVYGNISGDTTSGNTGTYTVALNS